MQKNQFFWLNLHDLGKKYASIGILNKIGGENMKCPKCGSENVSIQVVNKVELVRKHHSFWWWITIGWLWTLLKWLFFTLPALIFKVFGIGKKYKTVNIETKKAVCQNCGNTWNVK